MTAGHIDFFIHHLVLFATAALPMQNFELQGLGSLKPSHLGSPTLSSVQSLCSFASPAVELSIYHNGFNDAPLLQQPGV